MKSRAGAVVPGVSVIVLSPRLLVYLGAPTAVLMIAFAVIALFLQRNSGFDTFRDLSFWRGTDNERSEAADTLAANGAVLPCS
jgi:UPF0716 family protein affecting phage T7 exclusion